MIKKIFNFLLLLVIVAVSSATLSIAISKRGSSDTAANINTNQLSAQGLDAVSKTDTESEKGVKKLTFEESNFAFSVPNSTEILYYHPLSGQVKSIDLVNKAEAVKIIASIKPQASAISWAPDGKSLIAKYGDEYYQTNLLTGDSKQVPKNILNPVFSPFSSNIAYLYFNDSDGYGNISIADSQFKNYKNLLKTRLRDWKIQWGNERMLGLTAPSLTSDAESLFLLDTIDKTLTMALDSKNNLLTKWSPNGSKFIYSREIRGTNNIFVMDTSDFGAIDIKIAATASKCTWSNDSIYIYCADPQKTSDDTFVKINANTFEKKEFLNSIDAGFVDARDLVYVSSIPAIVFKNFKDGRLYTLTLSE